MKKKIKALALGAVLWDVINGKEYIGGAPFNFAANFKRLGGESALLTAIGNDERGMRALNAITGCGLDERFVQRNEKCCTGVAMATVAPNGDAVYDIPHAAFDEITFTSQTEKLITEFDPDVIYFGSFEQRGEVTRNAFRGILERKMSHHVFFDVNIRMGFTDKDVFAFGFEKSDIVKVNEEECFTISELFYGKKLVKEEFAERLFESFGISCVIVTLGEKGCYAFYKGRGHYAAPIPVSAVDTIGSGDAFAGAFLYSYLSGREMKDCLKNGNALGAFVASKRGALPELSAGILGEITR